MRNSEGRWGIPSVVRCARGVSAALTLSAIVFGSSAAQAWCRTTTCDPKDPEQRCVKDPRTKCVHEGLELFWPEKCLSFGVQKDGSPLRGISYETADEVIQEAFRQWMSVDCGGGARPSFRVWDVGEHYGGIVCNEPQFNENEPNANVWMFRDEDWPYVGQGSTLALTTITFEVPTGQILDADVEINSFTVELTTEEQHVKNDLLSIATHEAGHFLGLAHSHLSTATMFENYEPGGLVFRSLEDDDRKGICEAYPPDRDSPDCDAPRPRHGFSKFCAGNVAVAGCTVAPEQADASGLAAICAVALTSGLGTWARRRSRRAG